MCTLIATLFSLLASSAYGSEGLCSMEPPPKPSVSLLALSGSLRRLSSNSALARAAVEASSSVTLAPSLDTLPFFDADLEEDLPEAVVSLRALAFQAHGFLFATPEYNKGTSGVMKNAIDWLSRKGKEGKSPLEGKPYVVMSAGGGKGGQGGQEGVIAALEDSRMKRVGSGTKVAVKLWDGGVHFDEESGDLVDAKVRKGVEALVQALEEAATPDSSCGAA
jgi:chromate reductase